MNTIVLTYNPMAGAMSCSLDTANDLDEDDGRSKIHKDIFEGSRHILLCVYVCVCVCLCVSVCVCVCVSFYLSISPSLSFLRLRKNCFRKPLGYAKTSTFPYWTQSRSWAYSQVSGLKYPSIKINLESLGMYKKKERYGELMEF